MTSLGCPVTLAALERPDVNDTLAFNTRLHRRRATTGRGAGHSIRTELRTIGCTRAVPCALRPGNGFFTNTQIVFSGGQGDPLRFELAGGNAAAEWELLDPTPEQTSYHLGRDPQRWVDRVRGYGRLIRKNVYPGIDSAWHGTDQRVEYDFLLAPGADPGRIRIRIEGARRIYIDGNGELVVSGDSREIRQRQPVIYQTTEDGGRSPVSGGFRVFGASEAGFFVGTYDRSRPLIIDPVIDFSSYLGGDGEDEIIYSGNGITAGNTTSIDFPGAAPARRNRSKVFYRTGRFTQIIGGSGNDRLTAVLPSDTYFGFLLLGHTDSADLPTSLGALQPNYAGGASDGFIVHLVPQVTGPQSSTVSYYGTDGEDRLTGGTTLLSGICAFTGWTTSRGFPLGSIRGSGPIPAAASTPQGVGG